MGIIKGSVFCIHFNKNIKWEKNGTFFGHSENAQNQVIVVTLIISECIVNFMAASFTAGNRLIMKNN